MNQTNLIPQLGEAIGTTGRLTSGHPVRSTCPYCGVGCGIVAKPAGDNANTSLLTIDGDAAHPANAGRLCVKGSSLADTLEDSGRLLYPVVAGQRASWESATELVARKFAAAREEFGPDSVAFYLSGQLLTEDYYVANKLLKGFIGTANVDTNSRLCMASAVAAHKRAFGEDVVPCDYADLEQCELLVIVGANTAWTHPVVYQRIAQAKAERLFKVVVIDPRRTATCEFADLHLQIDPGRDVALFNTLLQHLAARGCIDSEFVANSCGGLEDVLDASAAADTGVEPEKLQQFLAWFTATERTVTLFSQGVNQSTQGTNAGNAIINCHLLTGRIGRPGMGPFSITGQPNAMGGREVGGLANQLAAHMEFDEASVNRVGRFWGSKTMAQQPGLKAIDLFKAVKRGDIKALWIMGTNPAVSLPESDSVREGLARCPFVVVSDCSVNTDTLRYADVQLPALGWGEKDGTVTNSERVISRQRAFLPAPGEARADWRIVQGVARALGHVQAFDYAGPHEIFREHAQLTAFENNGRRVLDLAFLANLNEAEYDELAPQSWPESQRPFNRSAPVSFSTPDGRARFIATPAANPVATPTREFPILINSGRSRDQWHTMTRTGGVERLCRHEEVPRVIVNPCDARDRKIATDDVVRIHNATGQVRMPVTVDDSVRRGQAYVPIHWSGTYSGAAVVNALYSNNVDPVSGQPESKQTVCELEPLPVASWLRFLISHRHIDSSESPTDGGPLDLFLTALKSAALFWAKIGRREEVFYEFALPAGASGIDALTKAAPRVINLADEASGLYRTLGFNDSKALWCAVSGPTRKALPAADGLAALLEDGEPSWLSLAMGGLNELDSSPTVCSCFEVREAKIREAIQAGCDTAAGLGERLGCGTNCGSCIPELKALCRPT